MVSYHKFLHHDRHHRLRGKSKMEEIAARDPDPQVVSVVLVTIEPTFGGPVAGYTTLTGDETTEGSSGGGTLIGAPVQAGSTTDPTQTDSGKTSPGGSLPVATAAESPSSRSPVASPAVSDQSTSEIPSNTIATSASAENGNSTAFGAATASPTSQPSETSQSSGLSTGAKAGLAIGLILVIVAIAAGVLYIYSKKKRENENCGKADDEKTSFQPVKPPMTADSAAPRLSIRPMSRLLPEFGGAKKRASQGNPLATFNETPPINGARNLTPSPPGASPWERRADDRAVTPSNPFRDPPNPFADSNRAPPPLSANVPFDSNPAVAAGIAGTAAGAGLAALAAKERQNSPKPLSPREFPSPALSSATGPASPPAASPVVAPAPIPALAPAPAASTTSAVPAPAPQTSPPTAVAVGAIATAPAENGPGNVYRVQMDFKPSMDDELELRAGQLVRLVHEYDDGWALCVRLDRSQQGVAPRTCLAANPSKPRPPQGSPRGPGPNGIPLRPGPNGRMSPAMNGRMSPAMNGRMSPAMNGRMSPAINRPMSPAGPGPRSQSPRPASPQLRGSRSNTPNGGRRGLPSGMRSMSPGPGAFNQAPRPLSPGPRPSPQRSMSPGPYGPGGAQKPMMPAAQRQRSNSTGAANFRDRRDMAPGPSRLGPGPQAMQSASPGLAM